MRDENKDQKQIKTPKVLTAALVLGAAFLLPQTGKALTLPTTTCDAQQASVAHTAGYAMSTNAVQEDGTKTFAYGDNNSFVSRNGNVITFNVNFLFHPGPMIYIKVFFMNKSCVVGAAAAFGGTFPQNSIISYSFDTDLISVDNDLNSTDGRVTMVRSNNVTKYIWVEVWDGINGSAVASYSYLVDTDNIQNPTGEPPPPVDTQGINRPAIIIPGILGSAQIDGTWVIDPILHTYDDLIDTLKANGYVAGQTLFGFPYNWYQSNVLTAAQLKDWINHIKIICACDKVDLVAHSMGGLVARQYIESNYYQNDVNRLVFLGTPHEGSPKSYLTWEAGQSTNSIADKSLHFIFSKEAKKFGYNNVFDYVRNSPITSIKELLPIFDYLKDKNLGLIEPYPAEYPSNTFLENLKLNLPNLYNAGVKIVNIVGDAGAQSTINNIRIVSSPSLPLWEHGYPDGFNENIGDRGLEMGSGDGTVPARSANTIDGDLVSINATHAQLPTKAAGIIFNRLTQETATQTFDKFNGIGIKVLILKMLSPADMMVTAPDGKRIGKDFETGQEINEIPDAFYSGFETDNEFITISNPLDGDYQITTQGTDNGGEYTIASALISDSLDAEQDFTAQTKPGLTETIELSVDSNNAGAIITKPQDTDPPIINISSPQAQDYTRPLTLPVNVIIDDAETGVFSSSLNLDNMPIDNNSSLDLFGYRLGPHQLSATATDLMGNQSNTEVNFRIIATLDSTIADIERAFSLGWIGKKSVKNDLLNELKPAIKIEKRISYLEEKLPGKPKVIKRIEKFEQKINKLLMKELTKDLEKKKNKREINAQAHDLIVEDINWLINN